MRPAGRVCPGLQSVRETARDQADEVPEAAQVPSCLALVPRESISLVQMPNCPKLTEGGARALLLKLQCPGLRMGLPRSGQSSAFLLLSPAVGPRPLPVVPWVRPRPALCPVEGPALFQLHCQYPLVTRSFPSIYQAQAPNSELTSASHFPVQFPTRPSARIAPSCWALLPTLHDSL